MFKLTTKQKTAHSKRLKGEAKTTPKGEHEADFQNISTKFKEKNQMELVICKCNLSPEKKKMPTYCAN